MTRAIHMSKQEGPLFAVDKKTGERFLVTGWREEHVDNFQTSIPLGVKLPDSPFGDQIPESAYFYPRNRLQAEEVSQLIKDLWEMKK